jgi:ATP adenylyltransferase
MSKPCVYCELPEIREREIAGDELAWAFPTNIPITEGHVLVSPRRCVATLAELTQEERLAILALGERVMSALRTAYEAEGFNVAWNEGKLAGQNVAHFHLHIVPRKEGDTGLDDYDVRSHLYRTGDREPSEEAELLKIRDQVRAGLS